VNRQKKEDMVALLKAWRRVHGLSQTTAARMLGVPYKTLEKWEQGVTKPTGRSMDRMRTFFAPRKEAA
jgi:DNA-binding transcriptional regulator YiaG